MFLITPLFLFLSSPAISEEVETDTEDDFLLEEMSLASLLEFDGIVVSASKKEESIDTAPAIMSVFTRQNIIDTGSKNIVEALGIMTGLFSYDTYFSQYNLASMRNNFGGEHYLSKILFLVNGHPVFSPVNGGVKLTALPIEAVQRIEVVRGPVSVLFGTNALTGVINVITRKGDNNKQSTITAGIGSGSKRKLDFAINHEQDDFSYLISGTYQKEDGFPLKVLPSQDEAARGYADKDFGEDMTSLFSNIAYKGFEADIFYSNAKKDHKYGIIPNSFFAGADTFDEQMFYFDLRYQQVVNDDVLLNYRVGYDKLDIDWRNDGIYILESGPFGLDSPPHITDINTDSSKKSAEFYANIDISENWDVTTGIVYGSYEAQPYIFEIDTSIVSTGLSPLSSFTDTKTDSDVALYANTTYKVSDSTSLSSGFRYTDNKIAGGQFNYRMGLIYRLSKTLVVKGLYATSFRSPNLFERYAASAPILRGDENLNNEVLKGIDIGLYYNGQQTKASVNYYNNKTEDFIKRQAIDGIPTYANLPDGEKTTGLEFEFKHFFSKELSVFVNGTHSFSAEDGSNGEDLKYTVDNMANFGLTYKPSDKLTFSTFNSYRSSWAESPSFSVYNIHAAYKMALDEGELTVSLSVNNVFDEQYTYAEFSRGRLPTIPGGAPRTFHAQVSYAF